MKLDTARLSFSSLKQFGTSPAHWVAYKRRVFKTSAAMRRGSLTHLLALEPQRAKELIVVDVQTRANKAFKEALAEHGDEKVFTAKEFKEAQHLAGGILAHPLASKLIGEAVQLEDPVTFNLDGVKFRGFVDVVGENYIADLKITDPEPRKMQRWILDNLYHMQLALYGYAEYNLEEDIKFYIIACDPNPPNGVVVYEISKAMIDDGFKRAKLEVSMFKTWYKGWDGESMPLSYDYYELPNEPMLMELPNWYK